MTYGPSISESAWRACLNADAWIPHKTTNQDHSLGTLEFTFSISHLPLKFETPCRLYCPRWHRHSEEASDSGLFIVLKQNHQSPQFQLPLLPDNLSSQNAGVLCPLLVPDSFSLFFSIFFCLLLCHSYSLRS